MYRTSLEGELKLRLKLACTAAAPGEAAAAAACSLTPAVQLEADKRVVFLLSSVARALPETDEWDLSGLLVERQPVSRPTVVAWLNAAYQLVYEEDYEAQGPDEDPACSVEGLHMLLSFADAVDSTRPVLKACCSRLQSLQLHPQLGQQQVALDTNGVGYYFSPTTSKLVSQPSLIESGVTMVATPESPTEQQAAFKQQVAAQIERLLWLAYRLQLQPLVEHMHTCIQAFSIFGLSVLRGCENEVFTPRVLEAAASGVASLPGGKQMLVNSVRGEVLTLADSTASGQANLRPIGLTHLQQLPLKFDAVATCSTLGKPGVAVAVELDLFSNSVIKLGHNTFAAQLRIGPYIQ
ncbi:hypothetical protein OEZ85_005259 [Tetradesmus obliquus]|uniref:Uncharacterized protein n=1 Tax=Tetradesmus obliquus TaxID=3088 RepID=A0ABY8UHB7_TETOB|nr:hypothetical protein OEZ85_005259 [Tetradesmus obliquus]